MKIRGICILVMIVASEWLFAQGWKVPPSGKAIEVDAPAQETIFSVDFTCLTPGMSYTEDKGSRPGKVIKSARSLNFYRIGEGSLLLPSISEKSITGKYLTLECDFRFVDSLNSTLLVEFPNHSDYKRYIEISHQWLVKEWMGKGPGTCGLNLRHQLALKKGYYLSRFDLSAWHCLSVSFTKDRFMIFIDNYFIYGLGRCANAGDFYELPGEGYLPAGFSLRSKAGVDIRYLRYAQSEFVPPHEVAKVAPFAGLLTNTKLISYRIRFEVNDARIRTESMPYIDSVSDWLKQNPAIRLEIAGHTDSDGDAAANLALSQRRATSIVMRLVQSGIDSGRLVARGYGADTPLESNSTESGKAANRRVEFRKL
jgi:outer membrane protein OmpA-like peptidoglycan-associated protein